MDLGVSKQRGLDRVCVNGTVEVLVEVVNRQKKFSIIHNYIMTLVDFLGSMRNRWSTGTKSKALCDSGYTAPDYLDPPNWSMPSSRTGNDLMAF